MFLVIVFKVKMDQKGAVKRPFVFVIVLQCIFVTVVSDINLCEKKSVKTVFYIYLL